jgi:hypothetical protein
MKITVSIFTSIIKHFLFFCYEFVKKLNDFSFRNKRAMIFCFRKQHIYNQSEKISAGKKTI